MGILIFFFASWVKAECSPDPTMQDFESEKKIKNVTYRYIGSPSSGCNLELKYQNPETDAQRTIVIYSTGKILYTDSRPSDEALPLANNLSSITQSAVLPIEGVAKNPEVRVWKTPEGISQGGFTVLLPSGDKVDMNARTGNIDWEGGYQLRKSLTVLTEKTPEESLVDNKDILDKLKGISRALERDKGLGQSFASDRTEKVQKASFPSMGVLRDLYGRTKAYARSVTPTEVIHLKASEKEVIIYPPSVGEESSTLADKKVRLERTDYFGGKYVCEIAAHYFFQDSKWDPKKGYVRGRKTDVHGYDVNRMQNLKKNVCQKQKAWLTPSFPIAPEAQKKDKRM